ncbi:MAG TPA: DUF4276 family protein [Chitinophagales bacterium]|nr:DUF4276 family protein [Chitinophagales bacterium]
MVNYTHLYILVEGDAEQRFVEKTLKNYLFNRQIVAYSIKVRTSKGQSGGMTNYIRVKNDIARIVKTHPSAYISTMFDLYGLPNDFPKYETAQLISDPYKKVALLEKSLKEDIYHHLFIPYIQLHEFETLLLANPDNILKIYPDQQKAVAELKKIITQNNNNPEKVNGGKHTNPSKRIIDLIKVYKRNKSTDGVYLADVNFEAALQNCQHFREWVDRLCNIVTI